jgi:hypothetical protein
MDRFFLFRVLMVVLLCGVYLALPVVFGAVPTSDDPVPNHNQFLSTPDRYLGERIVLSGTVVDADPLRVKLAGPRGRPTVVTLTDCRCRPDPGDHLNAYGVVTDERSIRSLGAVVVPPWGRPYAYSTSALAGLWVLVRLVRGWRVDAGRWAFVRRDSRVTVHSVLRRLRRVGDDPDDPEDIDA